MAEILTGSFGSGNNKTVKKHFRLKPKFLVTGALAVCIIILAFLFLTRWTYKDYSTRFTDSSEYVLAYDYYSFNRNVLKAASDSASYVSEKNETYWTISYDMNKPAVISSSGYAAIYDVNGTDIVTCTESGLLARIKTSSPIMRAAIAENGYTAAITDDGTDAIVEYFDSNGQIISSIKTTMDSTGYPFDTAINPDGTILAVTYVTFEDSQMTSRIRFYNFTQAGMEREDNLISTFAYTGVLMPMVEYIGADTFAGFSNDGVYLYKGTEELRQTRYIESDGEIISAFHQDGYFGFISAGTSGHSNRLNIFTTTGRKKSSADIEIAYTEVSAGKNDIVLYNSNQIEVYALNGARRLQYDTGEVVRQITPLGGNRYILISEDEYRLIRLS